MAGVSHAETTQSDNPDRPISIGHVRAPSFARAVSKVEDTQNNKERFLSAVTPRLVLFSLGNLPPTPRSTKTS